MEEAADRENAPLGPDNAMSNAATMFDVVKKRIIIAVITKVGERRYSPRAREGDSLDKFRGNESPEGVEDNQESKRSRMRIRTIQLIRRYVEFSGRQGGWVGNEDKTTQQRQKDNIQRQRSEQWPVTATRGNGPEGRATRDCPRKPNTKFHH